MLSNQTRLRVEFLCDRIRLGSPVEYEDMVWLTKWSDKNPIVAKMVRQARRAAVQGEQPSEMDKFCQAMDLGDPDPSNHLSGPQDPITLAQWFHGKQQWFRGES